MLRIVIVEPEIFTLLGIKGAIEQSPDIEVTGDATSGKNDGVWLKVCKNRAFLADINPRLIQTPKA